MDPNAGQVAMAMISINPFEAFFILIAKKVIGKMESHCTAVALRVTFPMEMDGISEIS
jgi:hypothetical protein